MHWFSLLLLPAFASSAIVTGGDGGGAGDAGGEARGDGDGGTGGGEEGAAGGGEGAASTDDGADLGDDGAPAADAQAQRGPKEEPQLANFKGLVSARILEFKKKAPELTSVFKAHPEIQNEIEARFRRDAAYREVFPTVAEAHQMRDKFPNGIADVEAMESEIAGVEELDHHFYDRDRDGNFPGHTELISNMFSDDRQAAVSLFKTLPKEWARLDRESYNEAMGSIMGATIRSNGWIEYLTDVRDAAKTAKQDQLAGALDKMIGSMDRYLREKPRPTPEEERLQRDRRELDRRDAETRSNDQKRFNTNFVSQSKRLQVGIIEKHPAVAKLAKVPSITPEKRAQIVEQIRNKIEKFLGNSRSFMSKLRPAHGAGNLEETMNIQRAAWSQQWLLNRFVREVLRVETPAMVTQSREAARRGAPPVKKVSAPQTGDRTNQRPTKPYQQGGLWFWPNGSRMSSADILAGKHTAS